MNEWMNEKREKMNAKEEKERMKKHFAIKERMI